MHWLDYVWGICVWSSFCGIVLYVLSSFANISLQEKERWLLYFNCVLPFVGLCVLMSLPHNVMGWSVIVPVVALDFFLISR